jgi:hypothetical protein
MIPATAACVSREPPPRIHQRIQRGMLQRLHYYQQHPEEIEERLAALDREWDVERVLETHAAAAVSTSVLLGLFGVRKALWLAVGASAFLLQHAFRGSCLPLALFRQLGLRTAAEIEWERYALKILRGDLDTIRGDTELEITLAMLQRPGKTWRDLH